MNFGFMAQKCQVQATWSTFFHLFGRNGVNAVNAACIKFEGNRTGKVAERGYLRSRNDPAYDPLFRFFWTEACALRRLASYHDYELTSRGRCLPPNGFSLTCSVNNSSMSEPRSDLRAVTIASM